MGLGHISTSYGLKSGLLGATSSQEFLLYYSSYLWSLCRIYRTVQESVLPPLQALRLKESPCLFFAVKFCIRRTWRRALWLLYSSASAYASDNLVFTRSYKRKRKRLILATPIPSPLRLRLWLHCLLSRARERCPSRGASSPTSASTGQTKPRVVVFSKIFAGYYPFRLKWSSDVVLGLTPYISHHCFCFLFIISFEYAEKLWIR